MNRLASGSGQVIEQERAVTPPVISVGVWQRWARRIVPPLFLLVIGIAAYMATVSAHGSVAGPRFSHTYPADPVPVDRPKVSGFLPPLAKRDVVRGARVTSLAQLSRLVSRGALRQIRSSTWLLTRPVALAADASLLAVGPGSLELGPHAYLESSLGGSVTVKGFRITAVDRNGQPLLDPGPGRGFLLADHGQMVLEQDDISFLGSLAPLGYGISMEAPAAGSGVIESKIAHGYIGIYLTHATAVRIVGNEVVDSVVYGIDPHSGSSGLTIDGNHVAGSGVHGIVLAEGVHASRVVNNFVEGARDHGIVLFAQANDNVVAGNRVQTSFDGIVVTDSSGNQISSNMIEGERRFGLRISGRSQGNTIQDNLFDHVLVGAYLYAGASQNPLFQNRFVATYEDVRIRKDAPRNPVRPVPAKSELQST